MTVTVPILVCCIVLVVIIATLIIIGYFSNWFQSPLGIVPTEISSATQLNITVATDPSNNSLIQKFSNVYLLSTDLSGINIKIKSNTNDSIVWNPIDQSMYIQVYTLTNYVGETRRFAILQNNISNSVSDKLYICVFANTNDDVTMYAFGNSKNAFDYNSDKVTWFRRTDASSPFVTIEN